MKFETVRTNFSLVPVDGGERHGLIINLKVETPVGCGKNPNPQRTEEQQKALCEKLRAEAEAALAAADRTRSYVPGSGYTAWENTLAGTYMSAENLNPYRQFFSANQLVLRRRSAAALRCFSSIFSCSMHF
eukprot:GHVU01011918.1.p1 GENE.GHVU01011918.1~~GHVU01011918.1.p1  ORF type:complete len:131 (-),score=11.77 GHVU01011918.1:328-720(-)